MNRKKTTAFFSEISNSISSAIDSISSAGKVVLPDTKNFYPAWLKDLVKDAPEYVNDNFGPYYVRIELDKLGTSIVRECNGSIGFKVSVAHISNDSTFSRHIIPESKTIGCILHIDSPNHWEMYNTSENVFFYMAQTQSEAEKSLEEAKNSKFFKPEECTLNRFLWKCDKTLAIRHYGRPQTMNLSDDEKVIFDDIEEQDKLPEMHRNNVTWFIYRLFTGKTVKIVDHKYVPLFPSTENPDGYWVLKLA